MSGHRKKRASELILVVERPQHAHRQQVARTEDGAQRASEKEAQWLTYLRPFGLEKKSCAHMWVNVRVQAPIGTIGRDRESVRAVEHLGYNDNPNRVPAGTGVLLSARHWSSRDHHAGRHFASAQDVSQPRLFVLREGWGASPRSAHNSGIGPFLRCSRRISGGCHSPWCSRCRPSRWLHCSMRRSAGICCLPGSLLTVRVVCSRHTVASLRDGSNCRAGRGADAVPLVAHGDRPDSRFTRSHARDPVNATALQQIALAAVNRQPSALQLLLQLLHSHARRHAGSDRRAEQRVDGMGGCLERGCSDEGRAATVLSRRAMSVSCSGTSRHDRCKSTSTAVIAASFDWNSSGCGGRYNVMTYASRSRMS